ncbi:hypothetical protein GGD65_005897 [Bradyrhizobium sp. CIR18]|nr:hypothetical protein [Bradyrhizobium sp. CIR18]
MQQNTPLKGHNLKEDLALMQPRLVRLTSAMSLRGLPILRTFRALSIAQMVLYLSLIIDDSPGSP